MPAVRPRREAARVGSEGAYATGTVWAVAVVGGTPASAAAYQEIVHPVAGYIARGDDRVTKIRLSSPTPPGRFRLLQQRLSDAVSSRNQIASIGEFDGEESSVFGSIADAVFDPFEGVIILDDRLIGVRAFSPTGRFLAALGRPGSGPGEFRQPNAIAVTARGDVFVADGARRIARYRLRDGRVEGSTIGVNFRVVDLCAIGNSLVAHGTSRMNNNTLFVLDSTGRAARSFGETYRSPNPRINTHIHEGRVTCAGRDSVIVYAAQSGVPEARGFSLRGEPLWTVSIDGMIPVGIREKVNRPGSRRVSLPPNGYHHIESLAYHPSGFVLLQVAFQRSGAPTAWQPDSLHTIAIDARSGDAAVIDTRLPPILAISSQTLLLPRSEPFPHVRIHKAPTEKPARKN